MNYLCLYTVVFKARSLWDRVFLIKLELEVLVFAEGGKPEKLENNPRSKDENQQQTQPTYDAGPGN